MIMIVPLHLDVEVWPATGQSAYGNLQEHDDLQVVCPGLDTEHKQF